MPSSVIRRFDYDRDTQALTVLFVTGKRYVYEDVPPEEADAFRATFSKGKYFNANIRDRYAYRRLRSA